MSRTEGTGGRFITFEGGEGSGKSTQVQLLAARLEHAGQPVVATREPGGSPGAENIRKLLVEGEPGRWDPATEVLLHCAARRDHVQNIVAPALAAGKWVLSDRFSDSTFVYQGAGHGVSLGDIAAIDAIAVSGLVPDLTFILDLPVETGLARSDRSGGEDRYERMTVDFHRRVRQGFLDRAIAEPGRCQVLDANRDIDAVADEIWRLTAARFGVAMG